MNNASAANPVPMGLACFGVSVLLFSGYLWGFLQSEAIIATMLLVGGGGMLLAAVAAYRRGDTLDATWMGAYSAFWGALAFYMWFFMPRSMNLDADMGWLAVAWGIFTAYIFVVSLRAKSALVSLQLLLFFILFLFIWIGSAFHMPVGDKVAAIAGALSAIVAAVESCALAWLHTTSDSQILSRITSPAQTRGIGIPNTT